jgi:hypothetical protein
MAALLVGGVVGASCASTATVMPARLSQSERAQLYASVLRDTRKTSMPRPVVLDTLRPLHTLDADLIGKVMQELDVNRATVDAFLTVQRHPADGFVRDMVRGTGWTAALPRVVDSLRALSRSQTPATPARTGTDAFWTNWLQAYPLSNGYFTLSPAFIARNGRSALIAVTHACGQTCGQEEVLKLERDEVGVWTTVRRTAIAIR